MSVRVDTKQKLNLPLKQSGVDLEGGNGNLQPSVRNLRLYLNLVIRRRLMIANRGDHIVHAISYQVECKG